VDEIENEETMYSLKELASIEDLRKLDLQREDEEKALENCKEEVRKHELDMRLIDCEYQFDRNKVTFYFYSENRVDFRTLVRSLAAIFKTRIELRQIGVRDVAKKIGGIGICGLETCCTKFLENFETINLQMAEDQQVALNVSKLSGLCGRLLCCLNFEEEMYQEATKDFPKIGETIEFKIDNAPITGTVIKYEILKENFYIVTEKNIEYKIDLQEYFNYRDNKNKKEKKNTNKKGFLGRVFKKDNNEHEQAHNCKNCQNHNNHRKENQKEAPKDNAKDNTKDNRNNDNAKKRYNYNRNNKFNNRKHSNTRQQSTNQNKNVKGVKNEE